MKRVFVILISLLFPDVAALAATVLVYSEARTGGKSGAPAKTVRLTVQPPHRIRKELRVGDQVTSAVIADELNQVKRTIDYEKNVYTEWTKLDEKRFLQEMKKKRPRNTITNVVVEKGAERQVGKWKCRDESLVAQGKKFRTACLASPKSLGLDSLAELLSNTEFVQKDPKSKNTSVVVSSEHFNAGVSYVTLRLESILTDQPDLPLWQFQAPAGFKKKSRK